MAAAAKPILEINPQHNLIIAVAGLADDEHQFREDVAHLLFDEARILDGELPTDPKAFSKRLAGVMQRCIR